MSKSDEIAMLIPLYQQFMADRRREESRAANKLKRKQGQAGADTPPDPRTAVSATEVAAAEEVPIVET